MIKTLQDCLANSSLSLSKTPGKLDKTVIFLVNNIDKAIDILIPRARLCLRSVPKFDEECKKAQMRARKLKKIRRKKGREECWEKFRLAQTEKGWVIAKVNKKAYLGSKAEACNSSEELWKVVKHTKKRVSKQPCLPNIQKSMGDLVTKPIEKIEELKKVLLPTSQSADLSDIHGFQYPNGLKMTKITKNKIFQTIKHLWTRKAS